MTRPLLLDMTPRHCWCCHQWWHTNTTRHAVDTLHYCPDCISHQPTLPTGEDDAA